MSVPFVGELEAFKQKAIDAAEDHLAILCTHAQDLIAKIDEITPVIAKEAALLGTRKDMMGDLAEIGMIAAECGYDDVAQKCTDVLGFAPSASHRPPLSLTSLGYSLSEALRLLGERREEEEEEEEGDGDFVPRESRSFSDYMSLL